MIPVLLMKSPSGRDRELERQVSERLGWLNFGGLERAVQTCLRSDGYKDVKIVGCMSWRGRSRFGGVDLTAWRPDGSTRLLTLIQVKAMSPGRQVQRRFIDELRGAMLRYGAPRGIIVTTGKFSRAALSAAEAYTGRPVRLIDGRQLAHLMVRNGVGVRPMPLPLDSLPELVLDELFFDRVEELGRQ